MRSYPANSNKLPGSLVGFSDLQVDKGSMALCDWAVSDCVGSTSFCSAPVLARLSMTSLTRLMVKSRQAGPPQAPVPTIPQAPAPISIVAPLSIHAMIVSPSLSLYPDFVQTWQSKHLTTVQTSGHASLPKQLLILLQHTPQPVAPALLKAFILIINGLSWLTCCGCRQQHFYQDRRVIWQGQLHTCTG